MPVSMMPGQEIVPGFTLVRRLGAGMAGEVWVARASGGVQVAVKLIPDLERLGSQRELGALRIVREVKHPNLCPLFGIWFFDSSGNLLDASQTEAALYHDTSLLDTVSLNRKKIELLGQGPDDADFTTMQIDDSLSPLSLSPLSADSTSAEGVAVERPKRAKPTQMVVAMGLGEQTLYERLITIRNAKGLNPTSESKVHLPGGIEAEELLRYLGSAASAIDELNQRYSIYHCDIKPQNILIVGGQAQVCDFGLAQRVEQTRQTQLAFGTPAYGAPEMLFERTYSKTIDQYSLAVTYYELRTGFLPFDRVTQSSIVKAKASGKLDLSLVSAAERKVLVKATALDPESRYADCQSFVAALSNAVHPAVTQRTWRLPMVAAAIALVAATVGLFFWRSQLIELANGNQPRTAEPSDSLPSKQNERIPIAGESVEGTVAPKDATANADPTGIAESDVGSQTDVPAADSDSIETMASDVMTSEITEQQSLENPTAAILSENTRMPAEPIAPTILPEVVLGVNERLRMMIEQDKPAVERLGDVLAIFRSLDSDQQSQIQSSTVELLVAGLERAIQSQFRAFISQQSIDSALPAITTALTQELIDRSDPFLPADPVRTSRLMLLQLQTSLAFPQSTESRDLQEQLRNVRTRFDPSDQYLFAAVSKDAALAVALGWGQIMDQSNWDRDHVDEDLQRAQRLCFGDQLRQAALDNTEARYLTALLLDRLANTDPNERSSTLKRTAGLLLDHPQWSSLAGTAIWLVDPKPSDDVAAGDSSSPKRPLLAADPPATIPPALATCYRIAAGWDAWHRGTPRQAFAAWQAAARDPSLSKNSVAIDRQAAALYLLDWLVDSSKVRDESIEQTRYEKTAQSVMSVLDTVEKLSVAGRDAAADDERVADLVVLIAKERFLCNVAADQFDDAEKQLRTLQQTATGPLETALTPQLGRAVFELAIQQKTATPSRTARLLAACVAQTNKATLVEDTANATARRDELFSSYYRPTMEIIRPLIRTTALDLPTVPGELDAALIAKFSELFATMATDPKRRAEYKDILKWLDHVEVAAAIAGAATTDHHQRSGWYSIAFEAFLKARYEQQDDADIDDILKRMRHYHREASQFGETLESDFMLARILDQEGFQSDKMSEAISKYDLAVDQYDRVIEAYQVAANGSLGTAFRCRANVLNRKAGLLSGEERRLLNEQAIADARHAISLPEAWHADNDHRLETLADVGWTVAHANTSLSVDDKNSLFDESNRSIDQAIAIRKNDSIDYTHLAIKKLNGLWIDMLNNPNTARMRRTQSAALAFLDEISRTEKTGNTSSLAETTLTANSTRLRCQWHSRAARVFDTTGDQLLSMRHSEQAFKMSVENLSDRDSIRHIIALEYVILKLQQIETIRPQQRRAAIESWKQQLTGLQRLQPKVDEQRQQVLQWLANAEAAL